MGKLRALQGETASTLHAEHLIGRGEQCNLRLARAYVSSQHALIRWSGNGWELVDRGSRNGTYLDGARIEPGRAYPLALNSTIAFGRTSETWQLVDAGAPSVCVAMLDGDTELLGTDGVIGVPSDQDPQLTVFRDADGSWKLERPDAPAVNIEDGYNFEVAGTRWRFCCPHLLGRTSTSEQQAELQTAVYCFAVSRDQEYVELTIEYPTRELELGSRAHNFLLLLLAQARCDDRTAGLPESTCGWTYKEQLAESLLMTPQQIDGEVFRIRKHFAQHGVEESATVIERRPRTKQLRIGTPRIRIRTL